MRFVSYYILATFGSLRCEMLSFVSYFSLYCFKNICLRKDSFFNDLWWNYSASKFLVLAYAEETILPLINPFRSIFDFYLANARPFYSPRGSVSDRKWVKMSILFPLFTKTLTSFNKEILITGFFEDKKGIPEYSSGVLSLPIKNGMIFNPPQTELKTC